MQVYKVTNLINGKIYIGKDTHDNPAYLGSGKLITRAVRKYGKSNFTKEVLESCESLDDLNKRELFWIMTSDCFSPNGYNILVGSTGGDVLTNNPNKDAICQSMSQAAKSHVGDRNNFYGKQHSEETKHKIGLKNKIKNHEKDICGCASCKSYRREMDGTNNPHFGKTHSQEVKDFISKNNKGKRAGASNPNYGKRGILNHNFIVINQVIKNRVLKLRGSGMTLREIAALVGLNYNKTRQIILEYGVM